MRPLWQGEGLGFDSRCCGRTAEEGFALCGGVLSDMLVGEGIGGIQMGGDCGERWGWREGYRGIGVGRDEWGSGSIGSCGQRRESHPRCQCHPSSPAPHAPWAGQPCPPHSSK